MGYAGGIAGLGLSWAGMRGHGRSGAEAEVECVLGGVCLGRV